MSKFRRRLLNKLNNNDKGILTYWLCGEDAPIDGCWVDRIDSNFKWTLGSEEMYLVDEKCYYFDKNKNWIASFNDSQGLFNCGTRFYFEIDCEIIEHGSTSQNSAWILDYGALNATSKNFGLGIFVDSVFYTNYKMFGNETANIYGVLPFNSMAPTINEGRNKLYFGVEKYDNTQNIVYVKINDGEKIYAPNPHTSISHSNLYIRNYYIARGDIEIAATQIIMKVYNIKIYVQSYE